MSLFDIPEGVLVPIFDDHPTLDAMNASGHAFYLTGSRFAGTATDASDWDWFAQESAALWAFIQAEGFATLGGDAQADNVQYAEDHPYTSAIVEKGDVQIQVVKDVDHARQTRDLVYGQFAAHDMALHADKLATDARAAFWSTAAALVGLTRPAAQPKELPPFVTLAQVAS